MPAKNGERGGGGGEDIKKVRAQVQEISRLRAIEGGGL